MAAIALRRLGDDRRRSYWAYLGLVTLAELLTALGPVFAGLMLHALLLLALLLHGAFGGSLQTRRLALALTLAPLIRLLSLSLPLTSFPQMAWYPIVSIPLLVALWMIVRQSQIGRETLGLQRGSLPLQLALAVGGFALGAAEYAILRPDPLVAPLTWQTLWLPALSLMIFTGFTEEIIFRGLLQSLAIPVLGRWALTYIALLFAVLHIGYLSLLDVVFVFAVGIVFAYVVFWGGSLLGVTIAHGLTNITLFVLLPSLQQPGYAALARVLDGAIALGGLLAVGAILGLGWQAWRGGRLGAGRFADAVMGLAAASGRQREQLSGAARALTAEVGGLQRAVGADPIDVARAQPAPGAVDWLALGGAPEQIPASAYAMLYAQLTADDAPPLLQLAVSERASIAVSAIVFVPARRPAGQPGPLHLFAQGVHVTDDARQLLPAHFQFVTGIIAVQLRAPRNRRAWLRRSPQLCDAGRVLAERLTQSLALLADDDPGRFRLFWAEFGTVFAPESRGLRLWRGDEPVVGSR